MDESQKKQYYETYKKAKEKGEPFFPDAIFKDAVVSLLIFLILVMMALKSMSTALVLIPSSLAFRISIIRSATCISILDGIQP